LHRKPVDGDNVGLCEVRFPGFTRQGSRDLIADAEGAFYVGSGLVELAALAKELGEQGMRFPGNILVVGSASEHEACSRVLEGFVAGGSFAQCMQKHEFRPCEVRRGGRGGAFAHLSGSRDIPVFKGDSCHDA
jgi:hypothetical protein